MNRLLDILSKNSDFTVAQLADMLDESEEMISSQIKELEECGIIKGYRAVIDWESVPDAGVEAVIELKVTPQRHSGFDSIADTITKFTEVKSVFLMAGTYDLMIIVKGKTIQDVANFVAKRLSVLDGILSTSTHFLLKRYKEDGVMLCNTVVQEERGGV